MTTIQVNERTYQVEADENMPLLWVLRDILGLTGTKYGCGSPMWRMHSPYEWRGCPVMRYPANAGCGTGSDYNRGAFRQK